MPLQQKAAHSTLDDVLVGRKQHYASAQMHNKHLNKTNEAPSLHVFTGVVFKTSLRRVFDLLYDTLTSEKPERFTEIVPMQPGAHIRPSRDPCFIPCHRLAVSRGIATGNQ